MTILYLFRSSGTGHSIEHLFDTIRCEIEEAGIQTKAVRLPHISRGVRTVWQNLRFVKQLTASVFHITGDVHYLALALPASRTVLTIHDCSLLKNNRHRPLRYAIFWLFWYYLPIRRAGVVTAVSGKTRQELLRYVGPIAHKVKVVPNACDPTLMASPGVFYHAKPILLQIGTAPHKNLPSLIAAIEGISCTLVIVGPLTKEIRAELHQRQIDFRQYVDLSREAIVQLYTACDIVTFVSTYEGFGMPILEANAIGRAIITSDVSPMREVAAEAALLVNPTNIPAIRAGISRLIHDDIYRQHLIEEGLRNAQCYTVELAAHRYQSLYEQGCPSLSAQPVI
ncbi:glycosyltransferase family 4 protein [Spirosoma pollinicola]|uniref:Glycosyltransferase family 1 protein n=1 Tax=Spirosoma pollinicola TaxID=2057025 RepID=A0A2K8Z6M8_9BACT|nr:glycosyltransferase family 1 protein [Spirosoma pollinicola]AUD05546.1 glycosyltransferase family 1 protein [Spirosoma pollinicola]